jgi:hypothetical protein
VTAIKGESEPMTKYVIAGCILLGVLGLCLFSSDLKTQLFDVPAINAQRQSLLGLIPATTAQDQLLAESHNPLHRTSFCWFAFDSWAYKSDRTKQEIVSTFDQLFVNWEKRESPTNSGMLYTSGFFLIDIEWKLSEANTVNTYEVNVAVNDPLTPQCSD